MKRDIEKMITYLSLVLLPVAGGWVYFLSDDLEKATAAISPAAIEREVTDAYFLEHTIDLTRGFLDFRGTDVANFRRYFEERLFASGAPRGLRVTINQVRVAPSPDRRHCR